MTMTTDVRQGRYQVERPLGSGAMGTVVLARDTVLGRLVAIKGLAPHLAADDAFRRRFLQEARLAARLCHPNVVQIFDAGGGDEEEPFLVMEYVEGETVADRVVRGRPFSADEVVALALDLSAGLARAHALGIVHRDVKPHNVLLNADGLAKLTDFGIARALEDRGLTEIGTVLGTAPFMAPEQAAGHPVGPAADIFALGAVLRYAAGGSLPPAVALLVDAASEQDPTARPTAAEFHQRLAALADDPTQVVAVVAPTQVAPAESAPTQIAAIEPPAATETQGPERRIPLRAIAVAAVAIVVLVLLLIALPRGNPDAPAAQGSPGAAQAARDLAGWFRDQAE
jgi:eukaryotic-like serine/threonine-protein kinase